MTSIINLETLTNNNIQTRRTVDNRTSTNPSYVLDCLDLNEEHPRVVVDVNACYLDDWWMILSQVSLLFGRLISLMPFLMIGLCNPLK